PGGRNHQRHRPGPLQPQFLIEGTIVSAITPSLADCQQVDENDECQRCDGSPNGNAFFGAGSGLVCLIRLVCNCWLTWEDGARRLPRWGGGGACRRSLSLAAPGVCRPTGETDGLHAGGGRP